MDIWVSSQWQQEATEEFKLEVELLRITQELGRECLGNRGREAVWRPAASCAPCAVAWVRKGSRVDQAVAAEMERSGQT